MRAGLLGLAAVAGAAVAIAITRDPAEATEIVTATGGSVTAPGALVEPSSSLAVWPRGRTAWTIVLLSVPKVEGRDKAVAVAQQARKAGLRRVGVVDSSRFSSLRPGYWMTFSGIYGSEPEAAGGLRRARAIVRTARTQRVVP